MMTSSTTETNQRMEEMRVEIDRLREALEDAADELELIAEDYACMQKKLPVPSLKTSALCVAIYQVYSEGMSLDAKRGAKAARAALKEPSHD